MSHRSFRDFLAVAEQHGLMRRVRQTVDRTWEPASLIRWAYQALPNDSRFGLLFEDVEGSEFSMATGVLGASRESYAVALGVAEDEINETWAKALINPIPPVTVKTAACQEVVHTGDDVKLSDLPVPIWTPGKDPGPYITTSVMTRDANTGNQNTGVYRTRVRDDRHVVINLNPRRHGHNQTSTWLERGEPAPIAWIVAAEPAVHLASVGAVFPGVQEIEIAGGLMGGPIELVKCVTSDIMVPANAEMIIEGELLPGETDDEGPFGENFCYMSAPWKKPVVRITAITHRKNAIYYGITSQMPPSESTVIQSTANAALIQKILRHDLGETSVHDVHFDFTFGGQAAHGVISMTPLHPGHAKKVGRTVAEVSSLKRITLVDEDIDIRDSTHVDWAMNARYSPVRDTLLVDDVFVRMAMDPSTEAVDGVKMNSKIIVDATRTVDEAVFSLPSKDVMMKALDSWKEAGLPEFDI
ncbi:MAG: UbiD family decarboxylase, partial [Alphaproteobacteria bacterium]